MVDVDKVLDDAGLSNEAVRDYVKHWAEHGRDFDYLVDNGVHDTPLGPARRKIHYEAVGVVGAITPWNVPFYLNIAETVPALMAGNTVVVKPASPSRRAATDPPKPVPITIAVRPGAAVAGAAVLAVAANAARAPAPAAERRTVRRETAGSGMSNFTVKP